MNSMSQINIYSYNVAAHGCVKGRETMRIKIGFGMKTNLNKNKSQVCFETIWYKAFNYIL